MQSARPTASRPPVRGPSAGILGLLDGGARSDRGRRPLAAGQAAEAKEGVAQGCGPAEERAHWVRRGVFEPGRTRAISVAAGASFAAPAARGRTAPLYAHDMHAGRFQVGALFSVATLAAALLSLPSGLLIDRFGARSLLIFSLVVSGGSQLASAATTTVFPLFIWQGAGGLGSGAQQAALVSAITASV